MEPVSDAEKVRIAADFIKAAPAGEFKEVFNDVRILVGNDALLQKATSQCLVDYATDQFATVELTDSDNSKHNTLVTSHGLVKDTADRFIDPKTGKSFTYDCLRETGKFDENSPVTHCSDDVEKWRAAVQTSLKTYVEEYYPSPFSAVYGSTSEDGNVKVTVCIEDHKYSPQNFCNGKWRSEWSMELPHQIPSGGYNVRLTGTAKADVHYYEDGNVQLNTSKKFDTDVMLDGKADVGKSLVDAIKKQESAYQTSINESYTEMNTTTFKHLRRQLPITSNLIDWHKLRGLQVGKELMNKTN